MTISLSLSFSSFCFCAVVAGDRSGYRWPHLRCPSSPGAWRAGERGSRHFRFRNEIGGGGGCILITTLTKHNIDINGHICFLVCDENLVVCAENMVVRTEIMVVCTEILVVFRCLPFFMLCCGFHFFFSKMRRFIFRVGRGVSLVVC